MRAFQTLTFVLSLTGFGWTQDVSSVPECARDCYGSFFSSSGCSPLDINCACNSNLDPLLCCVATSCANDLSGTQDSQSFARSICAGAGITVPSSSPNCAAGGSSSSSESSSTPVASSTTEEASSTTSPTSTTFVSSTIPTTSSTTEATSTTLAAIPAPTTVTSSAEDQPPSTSTPPSTTEVSSTESSSSSDESTSSSPASQSAAPASTSSETAAATEAPASSSSGLSTGAKAGIGVAVPVAVLGFAVLGWLLYRSRQRERAANDIIQSGPGIEVMPSSGLEGLGTRREKAGPGLESRPR